MTKVLLDTNTLVSTILNSRGVPAQAYRKAVEPPYQASICEQTLEELRRVFNRKFPNKIPMLERFIATMISVIEVIPVPLDYYDDENKIRDADDRSILRAAIKSKIYLT
jgi:putative PIN family toxin of toxin-antitoxin system